MNSKKTKQKKNKKKKLEIGWNGVQKVLLCFELFDYFTISMFYTFTFSNVLLSFQTFMR